GYALRLRLERVRGGRPGGGHGGTLIASRLFSFLRTTAGIALAKPIRATRARSRRNPQSLKSAEPLRTTPMQLRILEKQKDSVRIEILNPDDTVIYPLITALLKDPDVEDALYYTGHPQLDKPVLTVKVKKGSPQAHRIRRDQGQACRDDAAVLVRGRPARGGPWAPTEGRRHPRRLPVRPALGARRPGGKSVSDCREGPSRRAGDRGEDGRGDRT